MGRGNRRSAIFKSSDDYFVFLMLLREVQEKYPFDLDAYCLMTNHFHLEVTTGSDPMDWEQFDEGRFEAEIEKVVVTNDEITLMRRLIPVTA